MSNSQSKLYSYTDSGAFTSEISFQKCLEKVHNVAKNTDKLLEHRLFQKEHITSPRALHKVADEISGKYKHLVILGMGGAILNPQLLANLGRPGHSTRITYCDHIDSRTINHLALTLDLEHTAFLVISKSGKTVETIALLSTWYSYMQKQFITDLAQRFYIITQGNGSAIAEMGKQIQAVLLPHDEISGRYASFTNITILPGLIAGQDMELFCRGGMRVLEELLDSPEDSYALQGAATMLYILKHRQNQHVCIPYKLSLKPFVEWQAQVVAESLGKDGDGITPLKAFGPLDQHSQLQLYLDGPKDKFFTIINTMDSSANTTLPMKLGPLAGHSIHELCDAECQAMLLVLKDEDLPHRYLSLTHDNEEGLGALIMHTMLETALCGLSLGIDPFNQPAVERIKRHILRELHIA
ncbi:MAG: hypothetical protein JSS50_00770 [Proteobacteria bacterium]|nr:hypothetical protein [Pseudomonadota bacterium]